MTILYQIQFGVGSYGFKESRLLYASTPSGTDNPIGADKASDEEQTEIVERAGAKTPGESAEEKAIKEIQGGTVEKIGLVDNALTVDSERHRETVDRLVQELPSDIDPAEVLKAKNEIERDFAEKQVLFNGLQKDISAFVTASGKTGEDAKKLEDAIGTGFFNIMPLFSLNEMKVQKVYASKITQDQIVHPLTLQLKKTISMHLPEGEKIDMQAVKELARRLAGHAPKFIENQKNVITKIDLIKRAVVGVNENMRRKQIEKRLITNAERHLGFPLKEGVMLQGMDIKWVRDEESGKERVKRRTKKWMVMTPEIEKTVSREGKAQIILKNVIVKLQDAGTGEIIELPLNNIREFIYAHDITPVVKNKIDLYDKADYLARMGITLKAGDELEFDVMTRDEKSLQTYAQANKVKIVSIDDKEVKFDRDVLYRAKWDSPDLKDHEYTSKMTLGEFSRWLNVRHALPTMTDEELNTKLNEQYEYLNKTYSRNKTCHRPVSPVVGEIIYAEAPGMPMYKITDVQPGIIEISYGQAKKQFTNVQFFRWVFENELEPFDPALQAERAKKYLGFSKRKAEKVLRDSEKAIDLFNDIGIWRNAFEELKKAGAENLIPQNISEIKTIEPLDAHQASHSALAELWRNTRFLSFDDLYQICKKYWEFFTHNLERKQKDRYSSIAKGMPFYGTDFERINQEAESEEIEHLKKGMKEWSPSQINSTLLKAKTKDQLRACIELLCDKGEFRWDDIKIWEMINKFNDAAHQIPIPQPPEMDPSQPYKEGTGMRFKGKDVAGKTGFDLMQDAIDNIFGESVYTDWKRRNDSTREDACGKAYNKARELEVDPRGTGGVARELEIMLAKHMNNEYIDASDFEGMLRYIIEMGKSGGPQKIYYLIMGLTAKNGLGRTMMSWDRLSYFIDKYPTFPALDYFTDKGLKRLPGTGELYEGPFRRGHFEYLSREWTKSARQQGKFEPPKGVKDFLYADVLTSDQTQERIDKVITAKPDRIDHDDYPFFGPALRDKAIEGLCALGSGGAQRISTPSYKNIYVGFSPRIMGLVGKIQNEQNEISKGRLGMPEPYYQKLVGTLTSFTRYDSILNSRYLRDQKVFRLSKQDLDSTFGWDRTNALRKYSENLQGLLISIINQYNPSNKNDLLRAFMQSEKKEEQDLIDNSVKKFSDEFEKMVNQDKGSKMIETINQYKFIEPAEGLTAREKVAERRRVFIEEAKSGKSSSQSSSSSGEDLLAA